MPVLWKQLALIVGVMLIVSTSIAKDQPHQPTPIVEVKFKLKQPVSVEWLSELVGLKPGDSYSPMLVTKAVKLLYGTGLFSNVRAFKEVTPNGIILTFELEPQIIVNEIEFEGNDHLDDSRLEAALRLKKGEAYNERKALSQRLEIIYEYLEEGFPDVHVSLMSKPYANEPLIDLTYMVYEGKRTHISQIRFKGKTVLPKRELRKILGIEQGDPVSLVKIRQGIEALREYYFERGWYTASVDFEGPNGISGKDVSRRLPISKWRKWKLLRDGVLIVHINPGQRVLFRFRGNRLVKKHELYDAIRFGPRTYLSINRETLNELRSKLVFYYQKLGFLNVKVDYDELITDNGSVKFVVFRINEGKRVRITKIEFEGNKIVKDSELRDQVHARLFEELVGERPRQFGPPSMDLPDVPVYPPEPEARWYYPNLVRIRPSVRSADPKFFEAYIPRLYERTVIEHLKLYYASKGFMLAKVEGPHLIFNPRGERVRVIYHITEGPQTRISQIAIIGAAAVETRKLLKIAKLSVDSPLNVFAYRDIKRRIRRFYQDKGYLYAQVNIKEEISTDYRKARLILEIYEGPQVRVGRIVVRGNRKTRDAVVLDRLAFTIGDVFTPSKAKDSEELLMKLGVFQAVNIWLLDRERPEPRKTVIIEVLERPAGEIEVGLGLSTYEGVRTKFNFVYRNLGGLALEFHLKTKVNRKIPLFLDDQFASVYDNISTLDALERNIIIGLRYPSIYGIPFRLGVGVDLSHLRLQERSYGLDKNSVISYLDTEIGEQLVITLLFEVSFLNLELTKLPLRIGEKITEPEGESVEVSPQLNVNVNLCDDIFMPTKGVRFNLNSTYYRDVALEIDTSLLRSRGSVSGYIPINLPWFWRKRPLVLKLQTRLGYIWNFIDAPVSDDKRFYLGGRLSLRGWVEQGVYPEDLTPEQVQMIKDENKPSTGGLSFVLFKAELRIPIYKQYSLGFFYDTGQLWQDPNNLHFDLTDYLSSAGFGFHYATPVGELNFDIGFQINSDSRFPTSGWATHFSIGIF